MKPILCLTTLMVMVGNGAEARSGGGLTDLAAIHEALVKAPDVPLIVNNVRYILVNERFEDVSTRKQARDEGRYIKRVKAKARKLGWQVNVLTLEGTVLLDATSLDALGRTLHGACTYYDEYGTVRAVGQYTQGLKTGTWTRYDSGGQELPNKVYYGEDWDAMQVRIGVATKAEGPEVKKQVAEF